jgi:hypothetical protein
MSIGVVVIAALVASGCTSGAGPSQDDFGIDLANSRAASGDGAGDTSEAGDVTLVLPPMDRSAAAERARLRLLVDRVLDEAVTSGPRPVLLEPASADALDDVMEMVVRRSGTVCVLGRDGQDALAAALALYPSRTGCALPLAGTGGDGRPFGADVDLEEIGRALGTSARAVAGDGTVVILDAGDGMLDRRWTRGVGAGASDDATSTAQHVVTSAAELIALLDAQAASLAGGVTPGGREALAGPGRVPVAAADDPDDLPIALVLPPVRVVVLDASIDSAALVGTVLDRGLLVLAPRSLLSDRSDPPGVVMRWRIRWDVPLALLVDRVSGGERPAADDGVTALDLLVMEPGPAARPS